MLLAAHCAPRIGSDSRQNKAVVYVISPCLARSPFVRSFDSSVGSAVFRGLAHCGVGAAAWRAVLREL